MNGGFLPFVFLGLTLGMALTGAPLTTAARAWAAAMIVALGVSFAPIPRDWAIAVEVGLWITTVLTAATIYLPQPWTSRLVWPIAVNAGLWLGATAAVATTRPALLAAIPTSLIFLLISRLGLQKSQVAMKVAASWMIAIGSLTVIVSMVSTPGYKRDHME